jgi:hypothetical protein
MLVTVLPSWTTPGRFDDPEDGLAPRDHLIVVAKPVAADQGDTQGNGFEWMDHRLESRGGVARGNFTSGVEWRISSFEAASLASAKRPVGEARCERAPAHSMLAKNSRVYAGDFPSAYNGTWGKHHVQTDKTACQDAAIAQAANAATAGRGLGRWRHLFIGRTTLN